MRGVYAITRSGCETDTLLADVARALRAGIDVLQYRNKDALFANHQAAALQVLCEQHGVPLIINDDMQLAQDVKARGVHLGQSDGSVERARALLGNDAIIGVTCHNDMELAIRAREAGASYVAFGAMYPSSSKPSAILARHEILTQAKELGLPVVAIGGITPDNGKALVQKGADMLAAIDGIFSGDIAANVRAYQSCFE